MAVRKEWIAERAKTARELASYCDLAEKEKHLADAASWDSMSSHVAFRVGLTTATYKDPIIWPNAEAVWKAYREACIESAKAGGKAVRV